ncbi:MAG: hypothetical protein WCY60_00825 [Trueperaceae bacterium]
MPPTARARWRSPLLATLLGLFAVLTLGAARAQDVDSVLANVEQAARALEDVSFLLEGKLVNADGTTITLEIDVLAVPGQSLASAYIIQPDALADNIIIMDGPAVYNYTFMTNQVMVFDADDPDALGGLLPAGEDGASANFSFDLGAIFAGFEASIVERFDGPHGETYRLRFANKDPAAAILDVIALVPSSDWLPRTLIFMQADGHVLAELHAERLEIDTGLDPEYVRELPSDAEVIDNRR